MGNFATKTTVVLTAAAFASAVNVIKKAAAARAIEQAAAKEAAIKRLQRRLRQRRLQRRLRQRRLQWRVNQAIEAESVAKKANQKAQRRLDEAKINDIDVKKIAWYKVRLARHEVEKKFEYLDDDPGNKFNEDALARAKHMEQQALSSWESLVGVLPVRAMMLVAEVKHTDHNLYVARRDMENTMFIEVNLENTMLIEVNIKGRKCIDVVEKECPPGFGLASGSKGRGFYHRDSSCFPKDIKRKWNYCQEHKEDMPYFGYYKPE